MAEVQIYICRNEYGVVIYVGMTQNTEERIKTHRRSSHWWPLVSLVEYENCVSRYDARRREAELIREHNPSHNQKQNRCVFNPSRLQHKNRPILVAALLKKAAIAI